MGSVTCVSSRLSSFGTSSDDLLYGRLRRAPSLTPKLPTCHLQGDCHCPLLPDTASWTTQPIYQPHLLRNASLVLLLTRNCHCRETQPHWIESICSKRKKIHFSSLFPCEPVLGLRLLCVSLTCWDPKTRIPERKSWCEGSERYFREERFLKPFHWNSSIKTGQV